MRRSLHPAAAALLVLAILAGLPLACICAPRSPAVAAHACCAPPPGLERADGGCCRATTAELYAGVSLATGAAPGVAALLAPFVSAPAALPTRAATVVVALSPPRLVLRV